MNAGNGSRQNQHVGGRIQQQIPVQGNPNLCQFQYVGMPIHHQGLKNNQFSPNQMHNHGYMGQPQPGCVQQPAGQASFPVATNMATPLVTGTFPTADILANFNQIGPPRQNLQYKTVNNWTNPSPQSAMTLPSIGSLWSHFQQQHNKPNTPQQQQQTVNPQQLTYLPAQPQQQFINTGDGLTLCGNPNIQYGLNQTPGTVNHNLNYSGFVINRLPQAAQNPQIVNTNQTGITIGTHQTMLQTTNLPPNSVSLPPQQSVHPAGLSQNPIQVVNTEAMTFTTASVAFSSNQVTIPTTTVTLTCSTSAQVTETATVHSQIPVTSVLSPASTPQDVKPQVSSLSSHNSCVSSHNNSDITSVKIPFGWKRVVEDGEIVYYSPSNVKLINKQEICKYLLVEGTCKCGLECPLLVDKVFNFDENVVGQLWSVEENTSTKDLSNLCNHKRKIIALAKFQQSQALQNACPVESEEKAEAEVDQKTEGACSSNDPTKLTASQNARPNILQNYGTEHPFNIPPNIIGQNHRMPKFMDMPPIQMNPFEVATKPRAVRKRKPRAKKSRTPDPAADLGPITCHVPQKLDFSQESHLNYRLKVDPMSCHMQPSLSPNDYQQGLVSPQGLLSPQGLVSPPSNVFSPQSQGMKAPVVFQNSNQGNPLSSGHFMEQVPTSTMSTASMLSQFQVPLSVQSNNNLMFQQMMPAHNPLSPRLVNNEMYNPNNPYQHNALFNVNSNNYIYPQMSDMLWMDTNGKPKSKRPRGKKDKHKLSSIVDRTSPCPNIDARNIGSKTPESSAELSFLENPTAFLAQQTVLVNNSIKSPLTQSKDLNPVSIKSENSKSSPKNSSSEPSTPKTPTTPKAIEKSDIKISTSPKNSKSPATVTQFSTLVKEETKESVKDQDQQADVKLEPTEAKIINHTTEDASSNPSSQNDAEEATESDASNLDSLHQMINATSQHEFPASTLLSAAARAQISQQQTTSNLAGQNVHTVTNTVADTNNLQDWMKILQTNNGAANMLLDQHTQIMLQQNPNLMAGSPGGLVNTFNAMTGLPLNMFFPVGQAVDPSALSPSNLLLNVNQQVPLLKADSSNTTTLPQDLLKTSLPNIHPQTPLPTQDLSATDPNMTSINTPMPRISVPLVSSVTNSISQVIPTVGVTQPILNQQQLTPMFGGMTFPAMNGLFLANPIAANQTCNQNVTLMDIVQCGDQNKASTPKASPTSEAAGVSGNNIATAVNQELLNQVQKNEQLGNGLNQQQLLFLPNINVPMMQVLGSNPFIQQADVDKVGIQNQPQYMLSNPLVDPTGQFCANQQNQTALLQLLGMQQMINNYGSGVSNLTPAQIQQVQTFQFQQLLLQQLQGLDQNGQMNTEVKGCDESEGGDEIQSESESVLQADVEDPPVTPVNKNHLNADQCNVDSNQVTKQSPPVKSNCVPRKKLKCNTPVNHKLSNHKSDSNHVTSDNLHNDKHLHHYNGEITLVNTNRLKRSRKDGLDYSDHLDKKNNKLSKCFNNGDLVWGEVAGYNWPGKLIYSNNHIYSNGEEKVLVRWFGDHGESRVNLLTLKSWDEGLLAHKMGRNFNATLEAAIQEALLQEGSSDLPLIVRQTKKKKV
ncbi:hypothetical protein LOTGIDRAFT_162940 [Lottia gigantea]|uniref:MBD domain-containing protein n=1 Tax=Lottia gigantea TaxID=225164 RepID=V4BSK3_LOTGI|nr:hypothetical protein LOTGIDRAFT_162940 [Lottia gigantea]ESO91939.1 hypothetical protein LOTGIDRAFT_162940 [Lottia gigantea]